MGQAEPDRPVTRPVPLDRLWPGRTGQISGLSLNSAQVRPGDLYVALPGSRTHGARHIEQALAGGAVAVLTDQAGVELAGPAVTGAVPFLVSPDPRATMAELAAQLYDHPARRLAMFAVTGTNGKTTTVFCLAALLDGLGLSCATIGTLGFRLAGRRLPWPHSTVTTPEAPDLQASLAGLVDLGCRAVAIEVSSHALALGRVSGIDFRAAAFTNLGADHLDYHGSQEAYFEAKASLFDPGRVGTAVIWSDQPAGRRLAQRVRAAEGQVVTVGRRPDPGLGRHLAIVGERVDADGSTLVELAVAADRVGWTFRLGLPGQHNVSDAALAVGLAWAGGLDPSAGLDRLAQVRVPGRLQRVDLPTGAPRVYVDFAHTPQAVESALAALRPGRTIVVLGAGGDRDQGKRGPMGAAAVGGADVVIVTDDNPRGEDPALIRQAVLAGARQARRLAPAGSRAAVCRIHDGGARRDAIRLALQYAMAGDSVAVLGKGHETTQEIGGVSAAFDDASVVAEEWRELSQRKGSGHGAD
ncbi:MAG: UDP-N-acetylmuramoyl-L-alanyl-D-glutamate--2,6-diaminopimelate ligase [Propionibacteriaceae bacterium]|jgi:UDP-N-acetylmuramoyl-L-alanyl-D-glutamate--2,6-diaminopimelate ligase|nr:UDP-N-acetylmuramoyl-L-alanyl-D-glutamate--2,6-diaminopimelate ligase [Propionibacteriaceae bacterium]